MRISENTVCVAILEVIRSYAAILVRSQFEIRNICDLQVVHERICDLGPTVVGDAHSLTLDVLHESIQIVA
jgi:hypothetical protein